MQLFYFLRMTDGKLVKNNELRYFPHGVDESPEQLASEINKIWEVEQHQRLDPLESKKGYYYLRRTCECREPHYTRLTKKIRRIFSFDDFTRRQTGTFVTFTATVVSPIMDSR